MKITKSIHVISRENWRKWLQKNYKKEPEIWLIHYKKELGKPGINYNDSVEEALCFGWIDSIVKSLDKNSYAQRFSPRNPKTPYSQTNKERMKRLLKDKKVIKEVIESYKDQTSEKFEIPKDILGEIKKNKDAWKNFQKYSQSYKRIRIGFVDAARKRPEEFKKRLKYFVEKTAKGKQFGYGGVQKYF